MTLFWRILDVPVVPPNNLAEAPQGEEGETDFQPHPNFTENFLKIRNFSAKLY